MSLAVKSSRRSWGLSRAFSMATKEPTYTGGEGESQPLEDGGRWNRAPTFCQEKLHSEENECIGQ